MFEKSHFDTLQDYIQSGFSIELTEEELNYYNALYAMVGISRKYGKDNAVSFLMHKPFCVDRMRARQMYAEAMNLFYLSDSVENDAYRNMIFDELNKAALVVLQNATSSKDLEVYGNLKTQAAKVKQLDKPDPAKPLELDNKFIKVYDLDPTAVGLPVANRTSLAQQIDALDVPLREKNRLRQDAGIEDADIIDMLDDQEEKTKDI
jgi:hypothetical protein